MLRGIAQWPLRKPLALFAAVLVGVTVAWSLWTGRDVPPNLGVLLQWFASVTLAAYYASSTTEAVKGVTPCPPGGKGSSSPLSE